MKKLFFILFSFGLTYISLAQTQSQRFLTYPVRNVGPVVQGARIVDIDVNTKNINEFYIAFASGGLYKTVNNGNTFIPVFDNQGSLTIGDIAVAPSNPNIVYVGSGENNSSRSSYAGDGIYKSDDAGKSWKHIGLTETQHIGRVIVHPENPSVVWVAAMGGLYSNNEERGVYRSTDGGESWEKVLYIDDKTGAIDLVIHPTNPDILYASMWQRKRYAWDFEGNGESSGIYKSIDGGKSWELAMNGIHDDQFTGRIGLAISASNPDAIYATLDYQKETKEKKEEKESEDLQFTDFTNMSVKELLEVSNEALDKFLNKNRFKKRYNAISVKNDIKIGLYEPQALANYFGDANEDLFNTNVAGLIVYKSLNGGESWERTHEYDLDGVYYTYGYYFGEIRVSPADENEIYITGVPLIKSTDGGKTFHRTDTIGNVHADHHSMWIDPNNPEHIILGNDGGLYISYDRGASWDHRNNMSVGQFYTVNVDMDKPYNIYGGLQDNGTLVGGSNTLPGVRGKWERLFGGDGMYVSADPRNSDIVYVGFQFGNYYRLDRESNKPTYITPAHNIGDDKLRFNWRTPVLMSTHNPDIIYMGSQKIHRSLNQGESWDEISDDLTNGGKEGNVPFGTITEIAESPFQFGKLYIGTDDGNVWKYTIKTGWVKINNGLPDNLWISSVNPSVHNKDVVYLSITGYRNDDFTTYVYKSENSGSSWKSIASNISNEPVNVIYEDLKSPELLYLGTDKGTYLSINAGENWEKFHAIPNVASYDMVIHPREQELVIGTHGRSVFVADLKPIQKIVSDEYKDKNLVAYAPLSVRFNESWGEKRYPYLDINLPAIEFDYFIKRSSKRNIIIKIKNEEGEIIKTIEKNEPEAGFGSIKWNGKTEGKDDFIQKGKYTVEYQYGKGNVTENLEVK